MENIKLISYSGFNEPQEIKVDNVSVESNYKGDLTTEFIEVYKEVIEYYNLQEMKDNQPLLEYSVWINPSLEDLQNFNESVSLDKNQYLENFKE